MVREIINSFLLLLKNQYFSLLFCLSCFLIILYYGLPIVPVLSPDSFGYLAQGKEITQKGFEWFLSTNMISTPLFPSLIASGILLGADPLFSGHIITFLALALLVFPVFYLGREIANEYIGYCSCILILTSSTMWHLSVMIWTEMPFILFTVTSLLFLVKYIKTNNVYFLILGGLFIALASIERYVGIFLVISTVVTIFIIDVYFNKQKFWRPMLFFGIASTPILLIILRNIIAGLSVFYTRNSMPVGQSIFYTVFFKVRGIFPSFVKPDNSAYFFLAIILLVVFIHVIILKKGLIPKKALHEYLLVTSPLWTYIGVFVIIFEIVYLSWQGFGEHGRLQVVIIPVIIIFALSFFTFTYKNLSSYIYKRYYAFLIIALVSITAISQIAAIPQTYKNLNDGYGDFYTDPCWRNNPGIEWLKENAGNSPVYSTSNDGYQISYYLGRPSSNFICDGYDSSECSKIYSEKSYRSHGIALENSSYIIIIEDYCQKKLGYRYNNPIIAPEDFDRMINSSDEFTLLKQFPDTAIYLYHSDLSTQK